MAPEPAAAGRRPISIAITALGGQGGGVLAEWLVAAAEAHGWWAQSTSVPGLAQRTGATVYYVEIAPPPAPGQPPPIMALMPMPGDVDLVIGAELMEAGRAMSRGFVTPGRTTLVASTHRVYGIGEKSALGDGMADSGAVLVAARAQARRLIALDMDAIASGCGCGISAVLLGAAAAAAVLPLPRGSYEQAIRQAGIAIDSNLAGFDRGFQAALEPGPAQGPSATERAAGQITTSFDARIRSGYPAALQPLVATGVRRLLDYQDARYADDYLDRLEPLRAADAATDHHFRLTAAVARHLALWMSYEDVIRVADLKTRAARFARVREEARASADQIVEISEFMHPRYQELCETLPAGLGARLLASERLRRWSSPLFARGRRIHTTHVAPFLLLWTLASLRRWRRRTLRFRVEQARIEGWLRLLLGTAPRDYELAVELAECQRLVKGYGDTHERGLRHFDAIVAFVLAAGDRPALADEVRALRAAALADEDGQTLARLLATLRGDATAAPAREQG